MVSTVAAPVYMYFKDSLKSCKGLSYTTYIYIIVFKCKNENELFLLNIL